MFLFYASLFRIYSSIFNMEYIISNILHGIRATLWPWFFCPYGMFEINLCLPLCFFAVFIFFNFSLLPSNLFDIVMPLLEVASTLQDHCLPQTTVTEPNFIQAIFSTLSNLKVSSIFHLKFERGC